MKRSVLLLAFAALAALALANTEKDSGTPYRVVHGWPQYPDGYALGQATGVGVDAHNCVFVFHRAARPVLRIDGETGEILDSFGEGVFTQAHGLGVDGEGSRAVFSNVEVEREKGLELC